MTIPDIDVSLYPGLRSSANPRVSTRPGFVDGTRPGGGNGGGSPGSGITQAQWVNILQTEGLGTPDPSVDLTNLSNLFTFEGAFRIPYYNGGETDASGNKLAQAICYRPPNGSNGVNGSIFVAARSNAVAEYEIPTLSADSDHLNLNPATLLQDFVNVSTRIPSGNTNGNSRIGWMKYKNGNLYLSNYANYQGSGTNEENIIVCNTPDNLYAGTYWGGINAYQDDWGARYLIELPEVWQNDFGYDYLVGVTSELSIVSRASFGHSLIGFDLDSIGQNTTSLNGTVWAHYSGQNPIGGYGGSNGTVSNYYAGLAWDTTSFNLSDFYSEGDIRLSNWGGINSQSLTAFTALPISETNRITTLDQFPLPDDSIRNHAALNENLCGLGFVIPNTDTICWLGGLDGARYGQGYKHYTLEGGPENSGLNGGFGRISENDVDPYIWLMNLNDVASRVNPSDPQYYFYGPWENPAEVNGPRKMIATGYFDSEQSRLYLLTRGYFFNQFETQNVVTVYTVNGGQ